MYFLTYVSHAFQVHKYNRNCVYIGGAKQASY